MGPLSRRAITIPAVLLGAALLLVSAPLWLVVTAGLDRVRGAPSAALRTALLALWVLLCETAGILVAGTLWAWHAGGVRARAHYLDRCFALQCRWAGALLGGARVVFGFELRQEPGDALPTQGPVLLLMRHASLADSLLPARLLSTPYGIRLRYVLKSELLWDPCLDLVGNQLPNVFVDRTGVDSAGAVRAVRELASDLGPRDGVMIYPEGTRFTAEKRGRSLERLREGDPRWRALAESLRHLLPPRPGGVVTLLDRFAEAGAGSVVVCGHTGFEGSVGLTDLIGGGLTGRTIRIRCWVTPAASLPADRVAWLADAWREVDAWIDSVVAQENAANSSWKATS